MSTFQASAADAATSGLRAIQVIPDVQERRRKEALFKARILAAFRTMHPSERVVVATRVCRELLASETLAAVRRDIVSGLKDQGIDVSLPASVGTGVEAGRVSAKPARRGAFGERV